MLWPWAVLPLAIGISEVIKMASTRTILLATLLTVAIALTVFRSSRAASITVTWNPLQRQNTEIDTLFLLDPDVEMKLTPGDGGLIPADAKNDAPWTKVIEAPGKFRTGLHSTDTKQGYVWMPSIGIMPPDQFTVEMWLKCAAPWADVSGQMPLDLWDEHGVDELQLEIYAGRLNVTLAHNQSPIGKLTYALSYDLATHPIPAGQWVNVAYTLANGDFILYIDGTLAAERKGIVAPTIWSDASRSDGLCILGGRGRGADQFTISDLRISRFARAPGLPTTINDDNRLLVNLSKPTGDKVRQNLLGSLHYLKGPLTEKMASGVVRVLRTDKMLSATPITAGPPDVAHPTKGVSGRYSYDWQVVDRTIDYYERIGVMPYISIDATPSILGGATPPLSGDRLATHRSGESAFPRQIPSDFNAFGDLVHDLVYHIVVEKGCRVPYWGVWNEPDGPTFWDQSPDDYDRLYAVCARAVKAVDARLLVGGPETAAWSEKWVGGLMQYCHDNALPLDFISYHYYDDTVGELVANKAQAAYWAKQYGMPEPPMIVGEWCWQTHNFPKTGYVPWRTRDYYLNDWHAAFTASSLITMQKTGVLLSIYTDPVAEAGGAGFDSTGLMSETGPWANLNVFREWNKMAPDVVESVYTGRPGVFSIASKAPAGGPTTVLLSRLQYRDDGPINVTVEIPGLTAGKAITDYVVDKAHSDRFDAGDSHADLESVSLKSAAGAVTVSLLPCSSHLLVIP